MGMAEISLAREWGQRNGFKNQKLDFIPLPPFLCHFGLWSWSRFESD